jgi:hypothetical protein
MTTYVRNQSRLKVLKNNDTPQMRAAVNLVLAVQNGGVPSQKNLEVLAEAFLTVMGGQSPQDVFGHPLGLVPCKGRPANAGFTPADIVSAVLELELRRLGEGVGSMAKAVEHVKNVFVDICGVDVERSILRDWQQGQETVKPLATQELLEMVAPYTY